jgi:hypothetical protein
MIKRNLNLNHINLTLREQLDQATIANQKLSQEIQKVNHEWIRLREQLETREREWREEENVNIHNNYSCDYGYLNDFYLFQVVQRLLWSRARQIVEFMANSCFI